jgi:hypothetical protein
MAHSTVGRITHNSTKQPGREERRCLAHVTLDDAYVVLQAITNHIPLGEHSQRALQLQTNIAQVWETTRQEEHHHPTAGAEINQGIRRWCRHKICQ